MAVRKACKDEGRLEKLIKIKALKEKKEVEGFEAEFKTGEITIDDHGVKTEVTESIRIEPMAVETIWNIVSNFGPGAKYLDIYRSLCYEALPELHDKGLLEEYGCLKNPESIVDEFLAVGDMEAIGKRIKSVIDGDLDIKN